MADDKAVPREISDAGGGIRFTATATDQVRTAARRDTAGRAPGSREPRMAGGPGGPLPTANGRAHTDLADGKPDPNQGG